MPILSLFYVGNMIKSYKQGRECLSIFIFLAEAVNMFGISLTSFYIFVKSINHAAPVSHKVFSILWCALWALLYAARPFWIPLLIIRPLLCLVSIIFILVLTGIKLETIISGYLLSYGISYFLYYIAKLIISLISLPFVSGEYAIDSVAYFDKPLYILLYALVFALQLFLSYLLFRVKRFKNGFSFLFKRYAVVVALVSAGAILILVTGVKVFYETASASAILLFIAGVLIVGNGIFIWIRRGIKMFYKRKMKEHSIDLLEQELAEKDSKIQRLTEQNDTLRVANHKINHRLESLERSVAGLAEKARGNAFSMEISEELSITLEDVKRLSRDYQAEVGLLKGKKPLPSTKIKMLDDMFGYFSEKCADGEIDFHLKVSGSIPYMVKHVINKSKLETMIGDHLQNALIAVNASDNTLRSILAVLELAGDCYELRVFDSGIPFEADTLARLGTQRVTTHSDTGGSGIGFMTTFEAMREIGASLVISEKKPSGTDFTKSVTIRFDRRNQYIIETYRPEDFPGESDRYLIIDTRGE